MCQTRLSSLGTLAVEARLARTFDFDSIIELFASRKGRKAPVLWSPYVIGQAIHYIFALWFLLSSSFPRLISAVADWMSTILAHVVWP